jgi:hypothetical protein
MSTQTLRSCSVQGRPFAPAGPRRATALLGRSPAQPAPQLDRLACRAQSKEEEARAAAAAPPAATVASPPATPGSPEPEGNVPLLAKGQGTAIWTGAVSVVLGVAYLALVVLMDSRGGQMLPPPPEAFLP